MNQIVPVFKHLTSMWLLLATLACTATKLHAATNIVLSGDNLQTRIDAAAAGDTMVIQSGAYGGTITINKALTLVRSGTGDVQLQGPVAINTAGAVTISQLLFADAVNITGGALVSVQESRFQGTVVATGGKMVIRRSLLTAPLYLTNTALTGLRFTNQFPGSVSFWVTAPANSALPMILSQCSLAGDLVAFGYSVSVGYSKLVAMSVVDGDARIVGNRFLRTPAEREVNANSSIQGIRSQLKIYNNEIRSGLNTGGEGIYGVKLISCDASVVNNTVSLTGHGSTYYVHGMSLEGPASNYRVIGNIVLADGGFFEVNAIQHTPDFAGSVLVSHCCLVPRPSNNNLKMTDMLYTDPGLSSEFALNPDSPCRDAGPPDAIYNDRDGTRNDIGYTGGPLYNPANYTTDLPIAFWLNTTPRKLVKGLNNTIRVDAAAVAGH